MLWTTAAPVLPPNHRLRVAFTHYGRWAAQHVKIGLPLSVACVFLLTYPMFFLYTTDSTSITNGASNLPHHVWTDAQLKPERAGPEPDVIMRSIWVHGSYMRALEHDVLLGALELQDELLGSTVDFNPKDSKTRVPLDEELLGLDGLDGPKDRDAFHIINGLTNQSWFFHSPLQYWSGSAENIAADKDIVSTVNERKTQSTSVNVTLRHSIVFSGKRFEDRRLVAADALVITLIHLRDSPVGRQWMRKAEALAGQQKTADKWTIIPADGKSVSSQLYEFQFRPISWADWVILTLASFLAFLYLSTNFAKIRAVKSKAGLVVAILIQFAASIASSFTVCAVFKVDVSRVPVYAYPLVVLAISMENSLQLTNAVIMHSSVVNVNQRIGQAFGETAHLALLNRLGHLFLLLALSLVTYPGVAAFCTFAAIAVVFDFLYLSTFFLLILKLDLRQRELSDMEKTSVKRANLTSLMTTTGTGPTRTLGRSIQWLRHPENFLSTPLRVAGTIVLVGFILVANYQSSAFKALWGNGSLERAKSALLVNIHQARSPTSWLRLQDHETAREVINVVKPWAHSYVARVYDPLVFVLASADRIPDRGNPTFMPAVYEFAQRQLPLLVAGFLVTFGLLFGLTYYLARDLTAPPADPNHPDDEPLLSVKSLSGGHRLDILMMAASRDGHVATVGLDRWIQVWDARSGARDQVVSRPGLSAEDPFPVLAMAIDYHSTWLALLSAQKVLVWNMKSKRWGKSVSVDTGGLKPEAFFFSGRRIENMNSLVIVKRSGRMIEAHPELDEPEEYIVCKTPLVWAVSIAEKAAPGQITPRVSLLTASKRSCVHFVTQHGEFWLSEEVKLPVRAENDIHALVPIPALSMYMVARRHTVDLIDLHLSSVVHTFETEPMVPRSPKYHFSSLGPAGSIRSFTLAYVHADSGDLVLQTYCPATEDETICSCRPSGGNRGEGGGGGRGKTCCPWSETIETRRRVQNPGAWAALRNGCVVGVRNTQSHPLPAPAPAPSLSLSPLSPLSPSPRMMTTTTLGSISAGLRRRHGAGNRLNPVSTITTTQPTTTTAAGEKEKDPWEVWAVSQLERPAQQESYEARSLHLSGEHENENGHTHSHPDDSRPLSHSHAHSNSDDSSNSRRSGGSDDLLVSTLGPLVTLGRGSVAVGFGNTVKVISAGHERFDSPRDDDDERDQRLGGRATGRRKRLGGAAAAAAAAATAAEARRAGI